MQRPSYGAARVVLPPLSLGLGRPTPTVIWRRRPSHRLAYNRAMRRTVAVVLILGFLAVDFLFFHDVLKPGEVTTLPQYMTGFLSVLVFAVCAQSLLAPRR